MGRLILKIPFCTGGTSPFQHFFKEIFQRFIGKFSAIFASWIRIRILAVLYGADLDQLYQRVGSVVEQELPGAALFGRSREKEAAPAPALQLKLHL